ncbi:MAG TPA: DUF4834 family protein [Paludibacter sp.]|nr:DUF4834 family protein [Paludibacter sp.]
MKFILLLVLIILFFGLFAIMAVFGLIRSFLGLGKKKNQTYNEQQPNGGSGSADKKPKIFEKSEGEYVDYEEIKD